VGTDAWRNWRAFHAGWGEVENFDDELHSDVSFIGGPGKFGPYQLSVVIREAGSVGEAVILYGGIHANLIPEIVVEGKLVKADSSAYHGGTIGDEIAALVSLELGVRLRLAGTRRISGIHKPNDPRPPIFFEVPHPGRPGVIDRELLPRVLTRSADLSDLTLLSSFPAIEEAAQTELVRAARAYAAAIWWANEDPNQAWLQLVTAVETAAKCRQTMIAEPSELVQEAWPELWEAMSAADDRVKVQLCELLAPQIKATQTFRDFIAECAPAPPDPRPTVDQLDWDQMRQHAGVIYRHRSDALHGGKPFPVPMLERPSVDASGAIQEKPYGLNAGALGGIWDAKETPMLLSTFEYVARRALLHWWSELAAGRQSVEPDPQ
jgi:hypothetical protein